MGKEKGKEEEAEEGQAEAKKEEDAKEEAQEEPAGEATEPQEDQPEENVEKQEEPGEEKAEEKGEAQPEKEPAEPPKEPEKPGKKPEKSGAKKIIRVGAKDLDGGLTVKKALPGIPGVGFMFANSVSKVCGFAEKKIGDLSADELKKLEDIIANPAKYGIPPWLYNRRFDPEDGLDQHLISARLELRRKMDINELKKRKCYRGVRHIIGLPVRGQRTRSSFRKSATVGVTRAKAKPGETKSKSK
jgi:small subunit ribosomal protein S13